MGLRKTLQTLCVVARHHYQHQVQFPETPCNPSLIICPTTLIAHWFLEAKKFVGDILQPYKFTGGSRVREGMWRDACKNNLVITSYDVVRSNISLISGTQWGYCVLDEGHVIKNPKTKTSIALKQIIAQHRLILSGTPIQNNVLELWSLFDFLMPQFLGSQQQFNDRYSKPISASSKAKCSDKDVERGAIALQALHKQVLPFILRRMKEDVLSDLPEKIIQDFYCEMTPLQAFLYSQINTSQVMNVLEPSKEESEEHTSVLQSLVSFRKLCTHPCLVIKKGDPAFSAAASHLGETPDLTDVAASPKLDALRQLLSDCGIGSVGDKDAETPTVAQHRALIFAQMKGTLDLIEDLLFRPHMPKVSWLRLDGDTNVHSRVEIANRFNADPSIDVLLLTTQVGGLGLNLTGADTVIFMEHDWNPTKDQQAMDRAHRIGQKRVVNVYRLIMRDTVEEQIMGLQRWKINVANSVVNLENATMSSMQTDQVLELFDEGAQQQQQQQTKAPPDDPLKKFKQLNTTILNNLSEMWSQREYDDFDFDKFLQRDHQLHNSRK
eukprot:c4768_g1_i1.p1 GENE.c4768_g1_i1~~c4768_g1_i1.p1  ORF type:complete len:551 (+),score=90.15 c4768_g1_i1:3-1655(+)